jgi:hypothetical protein
MRKFGIIGCGSDKRDEPSEARELYTSTYFQLKRDYAEDRWEDYCILSAEHGFLQPDEIVSPYDTTVTDDDFDREVFVSELADSTVMNVNIVMMGPEKLPVLAGQTYIELLEQAFKMYEPIGMDVGTFNERHEQVVDGEYQMPVEIEPVFQEHELGGIGEQMAWLKEWLDGDPDEKEAKQTTLSALTDGGNSRYVDTDTDRLEDDGE